MMENEKVNLNNTDNGELLYQSTFKISDFNDYSNVQNIYHKAVGKKRIIKIEIVIEIILVVIALINFLSRDFDSLFFIAILMIVFVIAIPMEEFLIRKSYLKKVFEKEKSVALTESKVSFYESNIVAETEKSKVMYDYSQITNAVFSKDVDLLLIGRMMICIGNKNFTIGNSSDFEEFIVSKIPQAEIKKLKMKE